MDSPSDLNATDHEILQLLDEGRETPGSLAEQLNKHRNYIGQRLRLMRLISLVDYYHRDTGMYMITEKGKEWLSVIGNNGQG